jgi:hypothetical protein
VGSLIASTFWENTDGRRNIDGWTVQGMMTIMVAVMFR